MKKLKKMKKKGKKPPKDDEDVQVKGPEKDFEKGVKAELKKDGSITFKELKKLVKGIAKKYKVELPEGW